MALDEPVETATRPDTAASRHRLRLSLVFAVIVVLAAAGVGAFLASQSRGGSAGTVRGTLITDGAPVARNALQLALVTNQSGQTLSAETTQYKASSNEKGRFEFTRVRAGRYVIIDLNFSIPLSGLSSGSGPSLDQLAVRNAAGTVLVFDVSASKGVDLGDVYKSS